eukprot:COSAG06_NODE_19585_length_831_cov_5.737705_1_plen_149_part_01
MATDSVRWLQPDHQQLRRLNGELDSRPSPACAGVAARMGSVERSTGADMVRAAIHVAGVGLSVDPPSVPAARAGRGRTPHTIRAHGGGRASPHGGLDGPRKCSSTSQTLPWLHLRGPSGRDVPIVDGLLVGRGAIGLAHSKKISRQHIV